jgi:tetratricopeptide (TPR) repeat protein
MPKPQEKPIEFDPNVRHYAKLGGVYLARHQWNEAEKMLREIMECFPQDAMGYRGTAVALAEQGVKLDEALSLAQQAMEKAPNDPRNLNALGVVRRQRGELAEAALKKALELSEKSPPAHVTVTEVTRLLSLTCPLPQPLPRGEGSSGSRPGEKKSLISPKKAASCRSCDSPPLAGGAGGGGRECRQLRNFCVIWKNLGRLYEKKGDREAAMEAYRKALELHPTNQEAKEGLERLEKKGSKQ